MITSEQRQEIVRLLEKGEDLSPEWARILFPPEKREYELVYHGKEREGDILANTLAVPLQPVRTFGSNGSKVNGEWHNMLIFGDNLQVMKSLLEMKKSGKLCNADGTPGARLIYIDPTFATKQEFRGSQDQKAYQDKVAGASFLEFLRRRLIFIRELLSEDGSLYVHLDEHMGHYGKVILDEIFGKEKFLNDIIWYYPDNFQGNVNRFANNHNIILLYCKSSDYFFRRIAIPLDKKVKRDVRVWNKEKQAIVAARDADGNIVYKEFSTKFADDVWTIGQSSVSKKHSDEYLGYPTQKPETLIGRVINASSKPGDLVLDCFVGSGTTLAVAEKLGRRYIGVDCGKLSIYTMQKRLLNIAKSKDIENPPKKYGKQCKPFTLYNAGLYDFSKLKELPWDSWRFFALQLFQCREEPHTIGGVKLDGYLKGASVLVFNHMKEKGIRIDEETIKSLHEALGTRIGNKFFIIAPALTFDFQQDYVTLDSVRYYALRIPYSIINELHQREFTCLKQPSDEMAVNDTVEAVGFDFIRTPELKFVCGIRKGKGDSPDSAFIKIKTFKSAAVVREPMLKKGNLETLSMVMIDYDFNEKSQVFDLDAVFYAGALEEKSWTLLFPADSIGEKMMAVFIDIYGNEARITLDPEQFGAQEVKRKRRGQ